MQPNREQQTESNTLKFFIATIGTTQWYNYISLSLIETCLIETYSTPFQNLFNNLRLKKFHFVLSFHFFNLSVVHPQDVFQ